MRKLIQAKILGAALLLLFLTTGGRAQTPPPTVSIAKENVSVEQVLKEIERLTNYTFFYNNGDFDLKRIVSVAAVRKPVSEVVRQMLPDCSCRFENRRIILVKDAAPQRQTVKGVVKDEKGAPVIGATVLVTDAGQTRGISTDMNGSFTLTLPALTAEAMLEVSFIGFDTYKSAVGSRTFFDVVLTYAQQSIDEVVVVGYGVQKKANLTGAVATVSQKELKDRPVSNVGRALQGVIPNLNVTLSSGQPGAGATYNIRGTTSPNSGSPLVLIDGVETYPDRINSNDIESITVLKDASSAAIYGARAAYGVVLVTTKHGTSDKMEVNVRANVKISYLTKLPEYLRAYDYAVLANEASAMRGAQPIYDDIELKAIQYHLDPDFYPDVNWQDEILKRTSLQQTYYASARGGGSIARYFVSMNMSNESAIYKQDENSKYIKDVHYNTYGMRLNVDFNLTKTTELYFGSDIYLSSQALPGQGASTDQLWDAQAKLTPLTIPVRYSTGELPTYKSGAKDVYSPYAMLNYTGLKNINTYSGTYTIRLQQDFSFLLRNLALNIQGAYSNSSYFEETRSVKPDMYWAERRDENGNLELIHTIKKEGTKYTKNRDSQYRKYFLQANLTWKAILNDEHRISALIHYEMSDSKNTKDLNKDGMAAIPLRYQGLEKSVMGSEIHICSIST